MRHLARAFLALLVPAAALQAQAPGKPVTGVERPEEEVRAALDELIAD